MKTKSQSSKSRKQPFSSKASHAVVTWIQSWVKASRAPWAEWTWNRSQQLAQKVSKTWSNAANWHSWSTAQAKPAAARKRAAAVRSAR